MKIRYIFKEGTSTGPSLPKPDYRKLKKRQSQNLVYTSKALYKSTSMNIPDTL